MSGSNFIEYRYDDPPSEFTAEDIACIQGVPDDYSEADREILRAFETARYNLTTKQASFSLLPGIRKFPGQRVLYFSYQSKKSFRTNVTTFFKNMEELVDQDDAYKFLCDTIAVSLADRSVYFPITFWGDLDRQERAIEAIATELGAKLARFRGGRFETSEADRFALPELTIKRL